MARLKNVCVSLPEEMHDKIKEEATKDDRSVSSWLRQVAEKELNKEADEEG